MEYIQRCVYQQTPPAYIHHPCFRQHTEKILCHLSLDMLTCIHAIPVKAPNSTIVDKVWAMKEIFCQLMHLVLKQQISHSWGYPEESILKYFIHLSLMPDVKQYGICLWFRYHKEKEVDWSPATDINDPSPFTEYRTDFLTHLVSKKGKSETITRVKGEGGLPDLTFSGTILDFMVMNTKAGDVKYKIPLLKDPVFSPEQFQKDGFVRLVADEELQKLWIMMTDTWKNRDYCRTHKNKQKSWQK
jgi:hypothetical protein